MLGVKYILVKLSFTLALCVDVFYIVYSALLHNRILKHFTFISFTQRNIRADYNYQLLSTSELVSNTAIFYKPTGELLNPVNETEHKLILSFISLVYE